ncbi:MAG: DUF2779 domain-containing protein [Deltaproteobacteria bacterium]|nr:DUF2779 domain-containing protein [Deltaproteobacteria bacterium]
MEKNDTGQLPPENEKPGTSLSKSLFIRGRQCHKSLWLQKHRPELKNELTCTQEAVFTLGHKVGNLAKGLFPGGVEVPYEGLSHEEQLELTREAIAKGTETIYEATFLHDGIFVKADILHHGRQGWELYEVKASTKVKDYHSDDAALQFHVLRGAGIDPARVSIVHIDNSYIRTGDLDTHKLFSVADITSQVKDLQAEISQEIDSQRTMLRGGTPDIDIGPHCNNPYECDFTGYCRAHVPKDSIFDLSCRGMDKFSLYRQGFVRLEDIPLDKLNTSQRFQVESTVMKRDTVNREGVRRFLDSLWHPLCFLDFETFMDPVPPFEGTRPYQQIPFQFSLHIEREPGAEIEHHGFLAEPGHDPRPELLDTLLHLIPEDACIIAWNQVFEIGVLRGLADAFPQHKERIERMIANFRDLMAPFRARTIYLWQAKGSYSIKKILPLLVPELGYEGMDIGDGGAAMDAWHTMNSKIDSEELERIRASLWEYCKLDTLAMVRILKKIKNIDNAR